MFLPSNDEVPSSVPFRLGIGLAYQLSQAKRDFSEQAVFKIKQASQLVRDDYTVLEELR